MSDWLQPYEQYFTWVALAAAVLFVATIVFLVLWLVSSVRRRRAIGARVVAECDRLELELELQEQLSRLRIVRELHEVVVHSISVIISQADGAQYTAASDPDAAARTAAVIAEAARTTLADLRRVMSVVSGGEAQFVSPPGLTMVEDLFSIMREEGLKVEFSQTGDPFDLKEGAELAVVRIVQEALTNALKFGGRGTEAKVSFSWTEEGLQVLIDDDGVRAAVRRDGLDPNRVARERGYTIEEDLGALTEVVSGRGITEMRERATLFGGLLKVSSVPGVGFSVSAIFPALRYDNGVHGVNLGA